MTNGTYSPHPLLPKQDQQHLQLTINEGDTIRDVLDNSGVEFVSDIRVWVNGSEEENLDRLIARNDFINIKADVQGGDGSNPLAIVAMVALIYFTGGLGAQAAFGMAGWQSAAVMIVGSMIINKLFPPTLPSIPEAENASPTYSLTGGRNAIRIDQPIPIICGTHKYIPDLGAKPFTTFEGEDQYFYQIFHFGMNTDIDITDLKIGEGLIDNYQDIEYQFSSGTAGSLAMFPGNVDTTAGAQILYDDGPVIRTSAVDTTQLQLDFEATLVQYDNQGDRQDKSVEFDVEYREVGSGTWLHFLPSWQLEVYEGCSDCEPVVPSVYNTVYYALLTNDSRKPLRKSYTRWVTKGQYEVRVTRRTREELESEKIVDSLNWSALRSYQDDTSDYTGQKRMALKVRATAQFSGSIDQLSATVSAKCPVWNGSNWNTEATSNPAWWFLYFARGRYATDSRLEFGGGFADSDIDIEGIKEWATWCDLKGLSFNFVFDRKIVVSDILNTIARTGRGSISYHAGSLGVVYDEGGKPITQVFGMSNIKEDTFQVSYVSEQLADEIIVEFINEELGYIRDEVRVTVPGVAVPTNPQKAQVPGVTNKIQAGKEANLIASEQVFRRRRVTFETDTEGLMCNKGDIIVVGHDLTSWGVTGRLDNVAVQSTTQLVLDQEITFEDGAGAAYYIGVRHPSGTYEVVQVEYSATPTNTLTLLQSLSEDPAGYIGNDQQDAIWMFEPDSTPGKKLKVIDIQVLGSDLSEVKITATDEDDEYYATEDGSYDYDTSALFNTGVAEASNLKFYENLDSTSGRPVVGFTWELTDNANGARVLVQKGTADVIDYGVQYGRSFELTIDNAYLITVKILAVPDDPSKISTVALTDSYQVQGLYLSEALVPVMADITGLELFNGTNSTEYTGNTAKFVWRVSNTSFDAWDINVYADEGAEGPDFKDYKVEIYNDDGSIRRTEYIVYNNYEYTVEKNTEDGFGTATRDFTIKVWRRGIQGQLSFNPAQLTVNNPAPAVPTGITSDSAISTVFIDCIPAPDLDWAGIMVWMSDTTSFTPTGVEQGLGNCVYKGRVDNIAISGIPSGVTRYFLIAAYDAFGTDELNYSTEFAETTRTVDIGPGTITETEIADNAISTPKLQALAVTANEIAVNTITAGQIASGTILADNIKAGEITANEIAANTITANKLDTGELITLSAQIKDAIIGTAEITNLAVTEGKIANLAVDTLKIAGNAVTIPVSAYTSALVSWTNNSYLNWRTIQSVSITSTGAPIQIILSAILQAKGGNGDGYGLVRLRRGTTTIATWNNSFFIPDIDTWSYTTFASSIKNTPGSGSFTYYLDINNLGGSQPDIGATSRSIFLLEVKK